MIWLTGDTHGHFDRVDAAVDRYLMGYTNL